MNELKTFDYKGAQVRTVELNGEPWWVLKDVCEVFGETNYRRVSGTIDPDEKGVSQIDTPGGKQEMTVVNEAGLYSTLFSMQPSKARGVSEEYIAERENKLRDFKRWVTHEVLPSIRKHGMYATPATVEAMLGDPDTMIKLLMEIKEERNARLQLQAKNSQLVVANKIMEPKAEYFDDLVDRGVNVSIRDTAKQLGVKQNVFVNFLLDKKYLYRDKKGKLTPYAQYDNDLFVLKECFNEKTAWGGVQTLITPKGRETFRLLTEGLRN